MKVKVYQPNNPTFHVLEGQKFNKENYHQVYEGELRDPEDEVDDNEVLEYLFAVFNRDERPAEYTGYSMSVEDIVELNDKVYVCNSFGFDKVNWEEK